MTDVWVTVRHEHDDHKFEVLAVTASLDAAKQAATDYLDPDWPALEWVQQSDGSWTTYLIGALRFTAEQFKVVA